MTKAIILVHHKGISDPEIIHVDESFVENRVQQIQKHIGEIKTIEVFKLADTYTKYTAFLLSHP